MIALIPSLITGDWATWIHRALVCLVASCPCSIVISVPLAYFAGIGAASKLGMLIKGGRFVETLARTYCIAFDKTGTLTENHISVKEIKSLGNYSAEEILALAASVEAHSAHPIAAAIRSYAEEQHISIRELSDYTEIPARGVGALDGDRIITCGKAKDIGGIVVSVDHEPIGVITLREAIRPEAAGALRDLHSLGVEGLCLLSGDKDENCRYVANQVGTNECYSELLPEDKVEKVKNLRRDYGSCVFVGDGINDAPVLSCSDCGIAMGLGSDAAIESADMVLSSENLLTIPRTIRLCRSTVKTVKANIVLSLSVKAIVIGLAIFGITPLWLAVLADTGVCLVCVLNAVRLIRKRF
jgi:Cd2+/Zn2+-exporting ATPase